MKTFLSIILLMFFILINSCDSSSSLSNPATLDNKSKGFNLPAFSFSKGKVVYANNPEADFVVLNQIDEDGSLLGLYLTTISFDTSFSLLASFQTVDSSMIFFDSLSCIPTTRFEPLAIPVLPNQVWAVMSHDKKFAKILILETDYHNIGTTPYGKVTFKWVFQKNGTQFF